MSKGKSNIPDHVPKKFPRPAAEFRVPLYAGRVYVFRDHNDYNTAWHFVAHRPNATPATATGGQHTAMTRGGDDIYLIHASSIDTLVHELGHAAFRILKSARVPVTRTKHEAFCYLQDAMFLQALRAWGIDCHGKPLKKGKRK